MQIKVKAQKMCAAEVIEAFDRFRLSTRLIPCDPDDRSTTLFTAKCASVLVSAPA